MNPWVRGYGPRASGLCIGGSGHGVARAAVWRVTRWVNWVLLLSNARMVGSPLWLFVVELYVGYLNLISKSLQCTKSYCSGVWFGIGFVPLGFTSFCGLPDYC